MESHGDFALMLQINEAGPLRTRSSRKKEASSLIIILNLITLCAAGSCAWINDSDQDRGFCRGCGMVLARLPQTRAEENYTVQYAQIENYN